MPNIKKFVTYDTTAKTVYGIIERQVDSYRLNDADGAFAAAPADPYVSFTEHTVIKGEYVLSENRATWNDGLYKCTMYEQAGGIPAPVSDMAIGYQYMYIKTDAEVVNESVINTLALEAGGNLATLLTRLSDVRATYLDYLFSIYFGLVSTVAQAQTGSAGQITLTAGASSVDDFYKGQVIVIYTGTGAGQARACYGYNGTTKVALTRPNWATAPDNTSWYVITTWGSTVVAAIEDIDFSATMKTSLATSVWNALTSGLTTVNSIGKKLADWVVGTIDTYTGNTKQTADVKTVTDIISSSKIAAQVKGWDDINLTAKMKTDVNAEADTALTDYDPPTRAELTTDKDSIISEINANEAKLDIIAGYIDLEITAIINAITALQADLGDPSVDVTTIYAQVLAVKGYVDDLETRLTATRAGYLDNLSGGAVDPAAVWSYATRKLTSRNIGTSEDIAREQTLTGNISSGVLQNAITVTDSTTQTITRGDIKVFTFNLGTGWNLTGKKAYFIAKDRPTSANSTAIVNRECTITDAVNGVATITLTATETAKSGAYYAEVEIRNTDDTNPQTAKQFTLKISQDVRQ